METKTDKATHLLRVLTATASAAVTLQVMLSTPWKESAPTIAILLILHAIYQKLIEEK